MCSTEEKAIFTKVKDISDYRRLDPEQRAEYAYAQRYRDYHLIQKTAYYEGWEDDYRQGYVEGYAEGWQQGRAERDREIILEMKLKGFDDALIASILHLSLDEIAKA